MPSKGKFFCPGYDYRLKILSDKIQNYLIYYLIQFNYYTPIIKCATEKKNHFIKASKYLGVEKK